MTQLSLIEREQLKAVQWMTPEWACVELVERFFPDLHSHDLVLEPSCGTGAFLKAIPDNVPAFGIELDPELAEQARSNTGRHIIDGDFLTVDIPEGVTTIVGNPPYKVALIKKFLARGTRLLPELGRMGMLLPAYAMQTHRNVATWLNSWSMRVELVPRRLFPRLKLPLVFVLFTRGYTRDKVVLFKESIGLALYREAVDFDRMGQEAKELLINGRPRRGLWRALVELALENLGGEADLREIYHFVEPRRPTPNAWWKEKIRQTLQRHFTPVSFGRWRTT